MLAETVEPGHRIVTMPFADRSIRKSPLTVLQIVRTDPGNQPFSADRKTSGVVIPGELFFRQSNLSRFLALSPANSLSVLVKESNAFPRSRECL